MSFLKTVLIVTFAAFDFVHPNFDKLKFLIIKYALAVFCLCLNNLGIILIIVINT